MNKDFKRRDEILGIANKKYMGGIIHFEAIDVQTLKLLIDEDFIELDEAQNCSPTTKQFYEFMCEHPQVKAEGYAVSPERDDYRVTIEGLNCHENTTKELKTQFTEFCNDADEFQITPFLRSWWD